MKTQVVLSFFRKVTLAGVVAFSANTIAYAAGSIADVCGQTASTATACTIDDFTKVLSKAELVGVTLILTVIFCFLAWSLLQAFFAREQGDSGKLKEALKAIGSTFLGIFILVAVFGGIVYAILQYVGVKEEYLKPIKMLKSSMSISVDRAYALDDGVVCSRETVSEECMVDTTTTGKCAQVMVGGEETYKCIENLVQKTNLLKTGTVLQVGSTDPANNNANYKPANQQTNTTDNQSGSEAPNPVESDDLTDFILQIVRVFVRFFVYPVLIAIWVWTGFAFIAAQGAPEALAKAKKRLMWAFFITLGVFMLQGILVALQATINKILE